MNDEIQIALIKAAFEHFELKDEAANEIRKFMKNLDVPMIDMISILSVGISVMLRETARRDFDFLELLKNKSEEELTYPDKVMALAIGVSTLYIRQVMEKYGAEHA